MRIDDRDDGLWSEFLEADRFYLARRGRFIRDAAQPLVVLRRALSRVAERGPVLRFLMGVYDTDLKRSLLPDLVRIASTTHADTVLARDVIAQLKGESWFGPEVRRLADAVLVDGSAEQYRRIAELYAATDSSLLARHLDVCRLASDPEVREICDDFETVFE